jgi:hypothetical protein
MPAERLITHWHIGKREKVRFEELSGSLAMLDRRFVAAELKAGPPKVNPDVKGIGLQSERFLVRGESLVVAAKPHQDQAPDGMSVG